MSTTSSNHSRYTNNSRRNPSLPAFAVAALIAASLLPKPASAWVDLLGLGATADPAEFSQLVSPNTQQNFNSWNLGTYSSPLSLGSNGYSADVEAKLGNDILNLDVISADGSTTHSLTTEDAGAELIYTATSGNPTGMGGYMRLVDATGTTTSGRAILNSFVMTSLGIGNIGPITLDFDATTGFDVTPYGLPSSFFLGVFLTQAMYAADPTAYYYGMSLQPDLATSSTLFAVFDTAGIGASTVFTADVPEPSTVSLFVLGIFALASARRRNACWPMG